MDEVLSGCMEGSRLNLHKLGLMLGGAIATARQEPNSKTAPLLVFGEIVALLWAKRDFENLRALDRLGDQLGFGVSTLCGYPMQEFAEPGTEEAYLQICAMHSIVIPPTPIHWTRRSGGFSKPRLVPTREPPRSRIPHNGDERSHGPLVETQPVATCA